ncbi:MAG TPA: 23S rRNA (uracil(1939)-C(5))-methyltransferase RlmD [Candidatus Baltobacteraceae bacterium]|nr:23S rRNA (uracil(1939)-C(5))-methyltransferase RlmD [Candidatus Baltobacteraceae bacterium]
MTSKSTVRADAPLVGDVVEVEFTDLIAKTGQAVGRFGGLAIFVWGPLPGEHARVRVSEVKSNYAIGELVERLETSPDRAEPFCEVFGVCGGCQLQHLAYPAQLQWKRRLVAEALARIGGLERERVLPTIGMSEPRAYRNKMSLVVGGTAQAREFGFYEAGTHDLVPIHSCPIVMPQLDHTIESFRTLANEKSFAGAFREVRHVVARVGRTEGKVVVALSSRERSPELAESAEQIVAALPGVTGLCNSFHPASENAVLGRTTVLLTGEPEIEETIRGIHFRVSSSSFFQVNAVMVTRILDLLAPHVPQQRIIFDLYCGAGTFSLVFAKLGARVVGIEENPGAVAEAIENAQRNGLADRVVFLPGRVERTIRSKPTSSMLRSAEVVFLDPPRKGSDQATLDAIVEAHPQRVWYLSCNPATLARDLVVLTAGGYRLNIVQPFDMFPQTGHVEALAFLDAEGVEPLVFS